MKISVLTPTYNRAQFLGKLYNSLLENSKYGVQIEWLIMDDGSTDETKTIIDKLQELKDGNDMLEIKYYYQENQGKMSAINNLVDKATGELIIECDSDDSFTPNAFEVIKNTYEQNENNLENIYALCFLKFDTNNNNMGNNFTKERTTMFDLYFKEQENGEKALVFIAKIRKQFTHKLENGEKFITEARMYHQMDLKYKMICINEPIMICEYQQNGYTKNIQKQFKENPFGYFEYFKEILQKNMKGVAFNKRLYAIKHYILFGYLTKQSTAKNIKDKMNKLLYYLLYIPGTIKSKRFIKT